MSVLKDLMKKKAPEDKGTGTAVKDLITATMAKGGKPKAIKVKVKFGGGKDSYKPKKRSSGITSAKL
jgi:hypothetical protein